jgi:nucleotide-binding universal stress UspA family protein
MDGRIVVGVDGSDSATDALHWAVKQAKLTGASVEAVYAWDPGTLVSLGMPPLVDWEPLKRAARARPRKIVRDTLGGDPGVRIVTKTLIGNAAEALVDRSAGADLLVVGSRGLGGLKGMLLGSADLAQPCRWRRRESNPRRSSLVGDAGFARTPPSLVRKPTR